jgi:hypothetical protein
MKAFPTPTFSINDEARVTAVGGEGGMDLRDYFAAKAMQGLMMRDGPAGFDFSTYPNDPMRIAHWAYDVADQMMKAREA